MSKSAAAAEPLTLQQVTRAAVRLLRRARPELQRGAWVEGDPKLKHLMVDIAWNEFDGKSFEQVGELLTPKIDLLISRLPLRSWVVPEATPAYRGIASCWEAFNGVGLRGSLYQNDGVGVVLLRLDLMVGS